MNKEFNHLENIFPSMEIAIKAIRYCYTVQEQAHYLNHNMIIPEHLKNAVPKRIIEYKLGRLCAKEALSQFAINDEEIKTNTDRSPIWPSEIVGSITHTENFVMAAVGRSNQWAGIGIDSEKISRRIDTIHSIANYFSNSIERGICTSKGLKEEEALYLLFSSKESIFKCLYPVIKIFFDFPSASLSSLEITSKNPNFCQGRFIMSIKKELMKSLNIEEIERFSSIEGFFYLDYDHVHTMSCVPSVAMNNKT